jgi:hypothetical protein
LVFPDALNILFIFDNIGHITIQDKAQCIERFQRDVLPMLHAVQNICRNTLFIDQMILGNIFPLQRFIKRIIAYHHITQ